MAQEELRPKPLHIIPSIGIYIVGQSRKQALIICLGPMLDDFSGHGKTGTLWKECYHVISRVGRVDILVVKAHDLFAMLTLYRGRDVLDKIADIPPRCPL